MLLGKETPLFLLFSLPITQKVLAGPADLWLAVTVCDYQYMVLLFQYREAEGQTDAAGCRLAP